MKNGGESGELGSIAQISLYVKEEKGKISTFPLYFYHHFPYENARALLKVSRSASDYGPLKASRAKGGVWVKTRLRGFGVPTSPPIKKEMCLFLNTYKKEGGIQKKHIFYYKIYFFFFSVLYDILEHHIHTYHIFLRLLD